MAIVVKDRVKVTTSTTGTGTLTLGSAETDFQSFSVIGDGNQTYYAIKSDAGWEVGIGTYTHSGTTLSRDTILESSNSGSAVSLTGTSTVFTTYPAERASFSDQGISKTFTADGAITAGKPTIITSAGKAQQIALSGNNVTGGVGTVASFTGNSCNYADITDIGSDKYLISYSDGQNSSYPTVAVATQSGENKTLTFDTAVVVSSNACQNTTIEWDSNASKALVAWKKNSDGSLYGHNVTVSGTTPTVSSSTGIYTSASTYYPTSIYNPDAQRVMVGFVYGSSNYVRWQTYDLSGSTPSQDEQLEWTSSFAPLGNTGMEQRLDYDTVNNKFLVAWNTTGDAVYGCLITDTGSGISNATKFEIKSATATNPTCNYDVTAGKWLVTYNDGGNSYYKTAVAITYNSGTANTNADIGTPVVLDSRVLNQSSVASSYDTNSSVTTIINGNASSTDSGKAGYYSVKLTGTVPSLVSSGSIDGTSQYDISRIQMPRQHMTTETPYYPVAFVGGGWQGQGDKCYYGVYTTAQNAVTNLDNNYLGVASTSASDTEEVKINLPEGSINNSQTGLTIGEDYFCNTSGEIKKFMTSSTSTDTTPSSSSNQSFGYNYYTNDVSSDYDTVNDKIGVLARSSSNYPTVTIGSQSGNTITWGTSVVVSSNSTSSIQHARDRLAYANGVFIATYTYGSKGYVCAGEVSGTNSITFGTEVQPNSSNVYSNSTSISYNDDASRWVYGMAVDSSTSTLLYLLTNSGTTISLVSGGSADATITNGAQDYYNWANKYDPDTNKTVIGVDYYSGSNNGRIYACTIGASSITVGSSPYSMTGGTFEDGSHELVYDTNQNKWLLLQCNETSNYISGTVITASTDTFSGGTKTVLSSDPARFLASYFDTTKNHIVTGYQYYTTGYYGKMGEISITGTTPSWTDVTQTICNQTSVRIIPKSALYNPDTNTGFITGTFDYSTSDGLATVIYYATNTTYTQTDAQYIGEAISTTALKLKETPTDIIFGKASNTIAKGNPVMVKTDGNFAKVEGEASSVSYSDGTPSEIHEGWVDMSSVSYDEAQAKFLVAYRDQDNGSYGFCKLVTVSNKTLTVGSETSAFNSNTTAVLDSMYIGDSKHCIVYYDSSSHGKAIIATVSGDSVTFGTAVTWSTTTIHSRASAYYDSNAGAVVISGRRGGSSIYYTVALSVSGTDLTAGSVVEDSSYTNTDYYCSAYDVNAQIGVVGFRNTSDDGYLRTISVSGNTVTLNTAMNFNSTNNVTMYKDCLTYDPVSQKCFILYNDQTEAALRGRVVSITGTTVTVGTDAQVLGVNSSNFGCQGTDQGGIVCVCRDSSSPYYLRSRIATISDTSFSMTNSETITSASVENTPSLAYQPSDYTVLIIYGDQSSHDLQGVCVIPEGTATTYPLTTENFIGLADNASTANGTSKVRINGVDANNSGLTAGQLMYVRNDGTLSETAENGKVVEAGKAISATKLLVKG